MDQNPFGIRAGEVAVELPEAFDAGALFHRAHPHALEEPGRLPEERSRIRCPLHHRGRRRAGRLRWPGWRVARHLVVLYWMDRARRDLVVQVPRHYGVGRGTFALRTPARPNPIAMSVARLLRVEGQRLTVIGLDCLDDTPLLDLKPYFASTDAVPEAVVGWHAELKQVRAARGCD